ncbi:MAG TPA: hypothetical protein PK725_09910 [Rhodocyclaceae bacterium]|jgi:hypothetical protein|nr:hypothetical protein [Rhodocyclaceae bacterium]HRQ47254.1 hypothetical protein [Rhodocyclaceae bacterium]
MPAKRCLVLMLFPLLAGCDSLYELLDIPDPQKVAAAVEAEGRAVGSACRHAGRSLEDCYLLNPGALKAAVYAGWRDMNDYMLMNNMEVVPSKLPQPGEALIRPRTVPDLPGRDTLQMPPPVQ